MRIAFLTIAWVWATAAHVHLVLSGATPWAVTLGAGVGAGVTLGALVGAISGVRTAKIKASTRPPLR